MLRIKGKLSYYKELSINQKMTGLKTKYEGLK